MTEPRRIRLIQLSLSTQDGRRSAVTFSRGLNVVFGPSDTGKSFLFQCIDYMLGGGNAPKEIPEAKGYTRVSLKLEGPSGVYLLSRSLAGGDFTVDTLSGDGGMVVRSVAMKAKHSATSSDNVSSFLLSELGCLGAEVRETKQSKRTLSFRDLARLALVDELRIFSEKSPIQSETGFGKTAASSVLRFALSGNDDSDFVTVEKPEISKARIEARRQLIEELRARIAAEIEAAGAPTEDEVRVRLAEAEALLAASAESLGRAKDATTLAERERERCASGLRSATGAVVFHSGVLARLRLLKEHYQVDIARLNAIAEGAETLEQIPETSCPICGALPEYHAPRDHEFDLHQVRASAVVEAERVRKLAHELQATVEDAAKRHLAEVERRDALHDRVRALDEGLARELRPRSAQAMAAWSGAQQQMVTLRRFVELRGRAAELDEMLKSTEGGGRGTSGASPPGNTLRASDFEELCGQVERLLKEWTLLTHGRVAWSERDEDLIIGGRRRASHGKGHRALTHASFALSLLRHALDSGCVHPGFVVLDSPLVAFKQSGGEKPGSQDDLSPEVAGAFYRSTAANFGDAQVIVIENKEPPKDLIRTANVIEFTGSATGRSGLLAQ